MIDPNSPDFIRFLHPDVPAKVRLLAIGEDSAVTQFINHLHRLQFIEAAAWSLPFHFDDCALTLHLEPNEILRTHAWRDQRRS